MKLLFRPALLCVLAALASTPATAQSSTPRAEKQSTAKQPAPTTQPAPPPPPPPPEEKPAPYDGQMIRLAEVLGSISYLRSLCGAPQEDWRASMRQLLDADTAKEPKRRERLTAAYNRGYRSFAAVHTTCTPTARTAAERYRNEGATLATEITSRFGN